MYTFNGWIKLREAGVSKLYTDDWENEAAEDSEIGYNQVAKMSSDPLRTGKFQWQHYMYDHLVSNKENFINGAFQKITSSLAIGSPRLKGKKIAQNYVMAQLQKAPITRKAVEFGKSLGYTPTMTVSPTGGYGSQSFTNAPQTPIDQPQYAAFGIGKGKGVRSKFRTF